LYVFILAASMSISTSKQLECYHCGDNCTNSAIKIGDNYFCCEGCKLVYTILQQNNLCNYYQLNTNPGIQLKKKLREDQFLFLDDKSIQQKIIHFQNKDETHVQLYLPQIHCSSCLYLLENLHRLHSSIISSTVNFPRKEVSIVFLHKEISLRKIAELLTSIGYEPYMSLKDLGTEKKSFSKTMTYQLGVAGFCFANIMLMSFPEYLGLSETEKNLQSIFRVLNIILALPVLLYSAQPFFESAWKALRHKFLNIDLPVALAILITFCRSMYEVINGISAGYFDSMTGIVFFMLAGRVLQNKTHQQLSFDRDYTSYFPMAITVIENNIETPVALPDIKVNNTLLIHHEELIPADGILTKGKALIDYSFVTGESEPVKKEIGELVYAGGKQTGSNIEILTIKEVAQSYLTNLWNNNHTNRKNSTTHSFTDVLSKYFTWVVLALALTGSLYWSLIDTHKAWNVITTVLIVACPCALLLSSSFTNGNILRILSRNYLYLRNAQTIEDIAAINHIVFDKTGTLTSTMHREVEFHGSSLSSYQKEMIAALAAQSTHPLSKAIAKQFGQPNKLAVHQFHEIPGRGIEGRINNDLVVLGSSPLLSHHQNNHQTRVHAVINHQYAGYFSFHNKYRDELHPMIKKLQQQFQLSVVSGDTNAEKENLQQLFGKQANLLFQQQPHQKLNYIQALQQRGYTVMMIGDGLNDAGALRQSNTGIAVTEDTNYFTPASDAIVKASHLYMLPKFIQLCRANRQIIIASFVLSIVYNVIGLFFALQGVLSPLIAAILMPASSISILLLTFGCSNLVARQLRL
jgi:P-type Cu+ transporter